MCTLWARTTYCRCSKKGTLSLCRRCSSDFCAKLRNLNKFLLSCIPLPLLAAPLSCFPVVTRVPAMFFLALLKVKQFSFFFRICRLKKKAFHESNKIKYTGLALEYSELADIITQLKRIILHRLNPDQAQIMQLQQNAFEAEKRAKKNSASKLDEKDYLMGTQPPHMEVEGSLYEYALKLKQSLHMTHVAGRTDSFVDEVLNLTRNRTARNQHPLLKNLAEGNQLSAMSTALGTIGATGSMTYGEALARNVARASSTGAELLSILKGVVTDNWTTVAGSVSSVVEQDNAQLQLLGFAAHNQEEDNDLTTQAFLAATSQQQQQQEQLVRMIAIQQNVDSVRPIEAYTQVEGGYLAIDLSRMTQFQLNMPQQDGQNPVRNAYDLASQESQQYNISTIAGGEIGGLLLPSEYICSAGASGGFVPLNTNATNANSEQFHVIEIDDQQQRIDIGAFLNHSAASSMPPLESDPKISLTAVSASTSDYESSTCSSNLNTTGLFHLYRQSQITPRAHLPIS
ncbi:hypothetical protein Ciccas_002291 [Cichlidogyrus casuarinus]|uniref:Uncharacterized protein n=1 Tax=Cichlidogyrus casuarinus TaxID=1844966 RepID=A0ABD2QKT9_9PLAT